MCEDISDTPKTTSMQDWIDRDSEGLITSIYKRLPDGRWYFKVEDSWRKHTDSSLMELCFQAGKDHFMIDVKRKEKKNCSRCGRNPHQPFCTSVVQLN